MGSGWSCDVFFDAFEMLLMRFLGVGNLLCLFLEAQGLMPKYANGPREWLPPSALLGMSPWDGAKTQRDV